VIALALHREQQGGAARRREEIAASGADDLVVFGSLFGSLFGSPIGLDDREGARVWRLGDHARPLPGTGYIES
jgi:hypothetical protein